MYNLREVFQSLMAVLEENVTASPKDFWAVYFHLWRYLYCLNQNIEESSNIKDKGELIEQFITQSKEISELEEAILKKGKVTKNQLPNIDESLFPPHIRNMKELLGKEQTRLHRLIKETKREKEGKTKKSPLRKKRGTKEKWIRS